MLTRLRSPAWRDLTLWSLDLETSGLVAGRDAILSLGMVPVRRGSIRWGERFYQTVEPPSGAELFGEAVPVHQLLPADLGQIHLREAVRAVEERLRNGVLLVHYGRLDVRFLKQAFRAVGVRWPRPPVVDTVRLLSRLSHRLRFVDPSAQPLPTQLGEARAALDLPPHLEHHALYDALATAELLLALATRLKLTTLRHLR